MKKIKDKENVVFVNMTNHEVHEMVSGLVIKKDTSNKKKWARAIISTDLVYSANGSPITRSTPKDIVQLPKREDNKIFIVSSLCTAAMLQLKIFDREDIVSPGPVGRDDNGKIAGCEGFRTIYEWEETTLKEIKNFKKVKNKTIFPEYGEGVLMCIGVQQDEISPAMLSFASGISIIEIKKLVEDKEYINDKGEVDYLNIYNGCLNTDSSKYKLFWPDDSSKNDVYCYIGINKIFTEMNIDSAVFSEEEFWNFYDFKMGFWGKHKKIEKIVSIGYSDNNQD